MRNKDPKLTKLGLSGYNKPKKTPNHPTKSHVVLAKEGDTVKTIRFGQQGVSGAGKTPTTAAEKARRKSFKARHAKNIAKGKTSAAYWANKEKWQVIIMWTKPSYTQIRLGFEITMYFKTRQD